MDDSTLASDRPTTWHLCWQAATGRNLLADPFLAERIRERLLDAHRRPGRVLLDYLVTPSEIHLVSELSATEPPGAVARAVANVVSRWVREVDGLRGPVLAERYRAHRIESDEELKAEVRLLAWRPPSLRLCVTPTHYAHSALRTTLGLRRAMGFDARALLDVFGVSVPEARARLRSLIARRPSDMEMREWELTHGLALATGALGPTLHTARQVAGAAAALVAASQPSGIEGALKLLERWVCTRIGVRDGQSLSGLSGSAGSRGRALVACLAVQAGLCSAASVARHFKRAKATLSEQMSACRLRAIDQQILATPMSRIVEEAILLLGKRS